MKPFLTATAIVLVANFGLPQPAAAQAPTAVPATAEDARLTAFLDAEFAQLLKLQPQTATRLGLKEGGDRWNDISDQALEAFVAWRQASAARMKALFERARLSPAVDRPAPAHGAAAPAGHRHRSGRVPHAPRVLGALPGRHALLRGQLTHQPRKGEYYPNG